MSRFSIRFLSPAELTDQEPGVRTGVIRIGDFEEQFESSVEFWTPEQYESQWAEALCRLTPKTPKSCLITSITEPATANFLFWWPMYLIGQHVHFQNHLLFFSEIKGTFDPAHPGLHVPERAIVNDGGVPLSEWVLPFSEVVGARNSLVGISSPALIPDNPVRP